MNAVLTAKKKYSKYLGYYVLPWVIIAFFLSFISFLTWGANLPNKEWFAFFLFELQCITPWVVFTPGIIWLYRKFDFSEPKRFKSLFVHFSAILICFSIHCIVQTLVGFSFFDMVFDPSRFWVDFIGFLNMRVIFYVGIVLAIKVFDFYKKDRVIALKEPRLRSKLNKTKFEGLKNQMQPQFILDTLDEAATNIKDHPEIAEEIVADLSDLLRVMLDLSNPEEVEVLDDLQHLSLYLKVLNKKTNQRVELTTDISGNCYDVHIPTVIYLIPLFEEIHNYTLQHSDGFRKAIYKVHKQSNRLYHRIILTRVHIDSNKLSKIQHKVRFQQMVNHLEQSYSNQIELHCLLKDNCLEIVFELPLKENPVLEQSFNKQENNVYN